MLHEYDMLCEKKCVLVYGSVETIGILEKSMFEFVIINVTGRGKETIKEIIDNPDLSKESKDVFGPCICIFNGLVKEEIFSLMKIIRKATLKEWIFATTTATNMSWKLDNLIQELNAEHKQIHEK